MRRWTKNGSLFLLAAVECLPVLLQPGACRAAEPIQGLKGRLFVGYQGWFACPGDYQGNTRQWSHWFLNNAQDADHLTEAVKQTQAAIDAGSSGQPSLVVEHAEQALTHAQAAEKERPSPKLEAAIKSLQEAVKQGKSGKVDVAMKAARTALQKLQA